MDDTRTRLTTVRQGNVPFLQFPSPKQDHGRQQCLIYMIPGNPGLIDYYEPFLNTLRQLLDEIEAKEEHNYAYHIYGRNLLGFEDGDHEPPFGTTTSSGTQTEPFSLEDQIDGVCSHLQTVNTTTLKTKQTFDSVILIGHSVGAYIALETFHRHHTALLSSPTTTTNTTATTTPPKPPTTPAPNLTTIPLRSGILLFPTVSHIAHSPSGRQLNLLRTIPFFDRTAHHIAKAFVSVWPGWALGGVVRKLLGFPAHAAAATLRFLAGRDGIWQAVYLGKDEMRCIGEEREEFVERRRRHEKGRVRVVVDGTGIPHAFCLHHSESVAEKVKGWIEDIGGRQ
ncbi:uncharacterized protein B0H64DRAFT_431137 [Chaetomium fimeti]|uniref:Uncharacterized protein n=1 Tax=Chaetomium fimeti TaxID=1854472 RepID=A0AAE0HID5_9PEZI|nr:hypothetical protein B0H64DRAFT_431137 [Chaetomium fimeti]